jgi:hypothetical protein
MLVQRKIDHFWMWFKSESSDLAYLLDSSQTREITKRVGSEVKKLTKEIGWELGPGLKREYSFSLTFNGCKDTIPLVERIVRCAPNLNQWEINCGRPPKAWDGRFVMKNRFGESVAIDSSTWSYMLVGFDGNRFFDVKLFGSIPSLDAAARNQACDIVIQSEIGERERLEWVDRIKIVQNPSNMQLEDATPIKYLRSHIQSLLVS